jgi:SHS family lactate transporter-like MFS transporter
MSVADKRAPSFDEDAYTSHPASPAYSVSAQLASWHANRGDKSILRSIIPSMNKPADAEADRTTKNPFKLLG